MGARRKVKEIGCQQILSRDGSVYSVQCMELSKRQRVSPDFLLERYFRTIRRCTGSLIRPNSSPEGVRFRLLGSRLALLSFAPPEFEEGDQEAAVHLCINGGFLVQPEECARGRFSLICERSSGGIRITVQLADYCPLLLGSAAPSRWRKALYRFTQAYIHKVVTVRYLADLHRELTGEKLCARVEKVRLREGEDI